MADETSQLKIDASGGISALDALNNKFRSLNKELINVRIASATLNKENNITVATILSETKAGTQLYSTFRLIDGQLTQTKTAVVNYTGAVNDAKTARERLVAAAKLGIPDDLAKKRERATPKERQKFDTAVSGLTNIAALNPDAIGAKQIETLFIKIRRGSKETYTGVAEDARQAVVKVVAASEGLGKSAADAAAKVRLLGSTSKAVERLQDALGPISGDATRGEITKIEKSLVAVRTEMRTAKLGLNDFKTALNAFKGNEVLDNDKLESLKQKIAESAKTYDLVNAAIERRSVKSSAASVKEIAEINRGREALLARQKVEQSLSGLPTSKSTLIEVSTKGLEQLRALKDAKYHVEIDAAIAHLDEVRKITDLRNTTIPIDFSVHITNLQALRSVTDDKHTAVIDTVIRGMQQIEAVRNTNVPVIINTTIKGLDEYKKAIADRHIDLDATVKIVNTFKETHPVQFQASFTGLERIREIERQQKIEFDIVYKHLEVLRNAEVPRQVDIDLVVKGTEKLQALQTEKEAQYRVVVTNLEEFKKIPLNLDIKTTLKDLGKFKDLKLDATITQLRGLEGLSSEHKVRIDATVNGLEELRTLQGQRRVTIQALVTGLKELEKAEQPTDVQIRAVLSDFEKLQELNKAYTLKVTTTGTAITDIKSLTESTKEVNLDIKASNIEKLLNSIKPNRQINFDATISGLQQFAELQRTITIEPHVINAAQELAKIPDHRVIQIQADISALNNLSGINDKKQIIRVETAGTDLKKLEEIEKDRQVHIKAITEGFEQLTKTGDRKFVTIILQNKEALDKLTEDKKVRIEAILPNLESVKSELTKENVTIKAVVSGLKESLTTTETKHIQVIYDGVNKLQELTEDKKLILHATIENAKEIEALEGRKKVIVQAVLKDTEKISALEHPTTADLRIVTHGLETLSGLEKRKNLLIQATIKGLEPFEHIEALKELNLTAKIQGLQILYDATKRKTVEIDAKINNINQLDSSKKLREIDYTAVLKDFDKIPKSKTLDLDITLKTLQIALREIPTKRKIELETVLGALGPQVVPVSVKLDNLQVLNTIPKEKTLLVHTQLDSTLGIGNISVPVDVKPSVKELSDLSSALNKLQKGFFQTRDASKSLNEIETALASGPDAINALSISNKRLLGFMDDVKARYLALGSSANASAEEQIAAQKRAIDAFNARKRVEESIVRPDIKISTSEDKNLENKLGRVQDEFERSAEAARDLDVILTAIDNKTVDTLSSNYRKLAGNIIAARVAGEALGSEERKRIELEARKSAKTEIGKTVRTTLETVFDIKGVQASSAALDSYHTKITTAQRATEVTGRTIEDFNIALQSIQSGDTSGLTTQQGVLRTALAGVKNDYDSILAAQKRTIDQAKTDEKTKLEAEQRVASALQARRDLEASLGLPSVHIDDKELKPFQNDLQNLRRELEKDVNGLKDFEKASAAFGGFKPPGGGAPPTIPPIPDDFNSGEEKYFNLLAKIIQRHGQLGASAIKAAVEQKAGSQEAIDGLQRQKDAANARTTLNIQFPLKAGDAANQVKPLLAAFNQLQREVEAGKLSINDFNTAINAFRGGKIFDDFGSGANRAITSLVGMEVQWQKVGATAQAKLDAIDKNTKRTAESTQRLKDATAAIVRLGVEGFSIKATASSGEIETFLQKIARVKATIERGTVSFEDFERVVASLTTNNVDGFSSKLLALRTRILDVRDATAKMGTEFNSTQNRTQGEQTGIQVESHARGFFDIPSLRGTPSELISVEKEITKLKELFKDGTKGIKDYDAAISAIQGKQSIDSLTTAQQELLKVILAIESAAGKTGTTEANAAKSAQTAFEKQFEAANKLLNINLKANNAAVVKQQRQTQAGVASTNVFQAFGPIPAKASGDQIETFKTKIASAVAFVQKGKVSLDDFNSALQRVLSGTPINPANITTPIGQVERRLQQASNEFNAFGRANDEIGNKVERSWSTVNRVFRTLVIGDVLGRLLRQFEQTTAKAAEFSISIGLLLTLSQDAPSNYNNWADAIRSVSDQLGKPITDVATAAYDALSNQVIESADDFSKFGIQVGKLAIITRSDLKSSIDAVSGVLNSFNLNINDTSRISNLLFKSIDLGKITMTQLSDTMGRLGPIINQLGIQTEEFLGFLTSTSRAGVSVDVAMTQVGQVLNALVKPNQELSAFFDKIGVSGAEAAISIFSFTGLMQKLKDETGGSTEALAKFFPELRGLRGIASLFRNDFKEFTGDLEKLRTESSKSAQEAGKIFDQNPGQKFRQELERIRNFFLTEWETNVLNRILSTTESFGGLGQAVQFLYRQLFSITVPVLTFAAIVAVAFKIGPILSYITGIRAAITALTTLQAVTTGAGIASSIAFGPVVGVLALISAALVKVSIDSALAKSRMAETARSARESASANASATTAEYQQALDRQVEATKQSVTQQAQAYAQLPTRLRGILSEVVEIQKEKARELADTVKESTELFLGSARSAVTELEQRKKDIQKARDTSSQSTDQFNKQVGSNLFDNALGDVESIRATEPQKAALTLNLTLQRINIIRQERDELKKNLATTTDIQDTVQKINDSYNEELRLRQTLASSRQNDSQVKDTVSRQAFLQATRQLGLQEQQLRAQIKNTSGEEKKRYEEQLQQIQNIKKNLPNANNIGSNIGTNRTFTGTDQGEIALAQERKAVELEINQIFERRREIVNKQIEDAKQQNAALATAIQRLREFSLTDKEGKVKDEFKQDPSLADKRFNELVANLDKATGPIIDLSQLNNSLEVRRNLKENLEAMKRDVFGFKNNLSNQLQLGTTVEGLGKAGEAFLGLGNDINKSQAEIAKKNSEAKSLLDQTQGSLLASAETFKKNFLGASEGAFANIIGLLQFLPGTELPFQKALREFSDTAGSFSGERAPELIAKLKELRKQLSIPISGINPSIGAPVKSPLDLVIDPHGISPKVDTNKAISGLLNAFDASKPLQTVIALEKFEEEINRIKKLDTDNILKTKVPSVTTDTKDLTLQGQLTAAQTIAREAIKKIQSDKERALRDIETLVEHKVITPEEGQQRSKVVQDNSVQQSTVELERLKKSFNDLRNSPEFRGISNEIVGKTARQILNQMETDLTTLIKADETFKETSERLKKDAEGPVKQFSAEFKDAETSIKSAGEAVKQFGTDTVSAMRIANEAISELNKRKDRLEVSANDHNFIGPRRPEQTQQQIVGDLQKIPQEGQVAAIKVLLRESLKEIETERKNAIKQIQELVDKESISNKEGTRRDVNVQSITIQQSLQAIDKAKAALNEIAASSPAPHVLEIISQELIRLGITEQQFKRAEAELAQGLSNNFGQTKAAIDSNTASVDKFGQEIIPTLRIANQLTKALADSQSRLKTTIPTIQSQPVEAKTTGGVIRGFAAGGFVSDFFSGRFARGVDNIPIMVSRGETVINAASSRKFYTQLQAINQNRQPLFNQRTSNTTTNIGDVNVNVTGSGTPSKTARQIGIELKREIRRGNLK